MTFHSFDPNEIERALDFAEEFPWKPPWPRELASRFLTNMVSSSDLVLDLWAGGERVALAVLLDRVQNVGNHAALEILGMKAEPRVVLPLLLARAQSLVPDHRDGIELTVHEELSSLLDVTESHGFTPYYESYEMSCLVRPEAVEAVPVSRALRVAVPQDDEAIYATLTEAFAENVDTGIPDFASWKQGRRVRGARTWVFEREDEIVAYIDLRVYAEDGFGEIRVVGVKPRARKLGIGTALMKTALGALARENIGHCRLTVAAPNASALGVYHSLGFEELDRLFVRVWEVPLD